MEENNVSAVKQTTTDDKVSGVFNLQFILTSLILNWKWYLLSLIICVGCAMVYLRYASPVYSISAKMLIKEDDSPQASRRGSALQNVANLGFMTNTSGFDNELEMLKSQSLSTAAVTDLKLYVNYLGVSKLKKHLLYQNQPINVDMDLDHLNELEAPVNVKIEAAGNNKYDISLSYMYVDSETEQLFPQILRTKVGVITITPNGRNIVTMSKIKKMDVTITNPAIVGAKYAFGLGVEPSSKTTTIAKLSLNDGNVQRGIDYLNQLALVYNRQANEDKNEIAHRTAEFINSRLEVIDSELGSTDGKIESYKRSNSVIDVTAKAAQSLTNTNSYERELAAANTQLILLNSIQDLVNKPGEKYQVLPSNVGLTDQASIALITEYNKGVLERNRMLHNASEINPEVLKTTGQLDTLMESLKSALTQAIRNGEISRDALARQVAKYSGQISQTPEQERVLTQIGRKQEVTSGLYLMLLQKREENSISLAATADKGKLIDTPVSGGKVKPRNSVIMLGSIVLGFAIPFFILVLIELLRYRIEGHSDVEKLTKLPIIADVAMASETSKSKADIVVHENRNDQMEEIFRSMRTNLQFLLKQDEKVVMFTSSVSGEGKTFCAANLAVSFALLGKKVVLVGLDIRRPRLNRLFELKENNKGITNLLTLANVTMKDIEDQLVPSGVNDQLDLLLAGPIPPNPTELISRSTLDDVIGKLKERYDYVIIDTAPVGLVTDTLSVGRVTDVTVFVCRADYTAKASFGMFNSLSEEKKLPNACIVINGIDMSKKKYGYAYGYGKYGKYSHYSYGYRSKYGYGSYGYGYGSYTQSHYGNPNDTSVKQ
ncbi:MAG: polysaccharide biosynthesis tyrosine autokinase [Prevotellaceae bacterium]|nr:polysaccharide biosynthesis tyrosine autokinase [Prevotellaceae bacterium]